MQAGLTPQNLVTLLLLKMDLTTAPNLREDDTLLKATKKNTE